MSVLLLEGSRVSSKKIEEAGYQFKFPLASNALRDLL
jgi:NAD dependent epimerase/dehydratase family enzyme